MKKYKLNINFKQLKEQKNELMELISKNDFNGSNFSDKTIDTLIGVIHLIDEIQDQAVDIHGLKEKDVFNLS